MTPQLKPRQLVEYFPAYHARGKSYQLRYRVIKRGYELLINGKPHGVYRHSDHALLAILEQRTGWQQDEVPAKYRKVLAQIETATGIKFEGLPK